MGAVPSSVPAAVPSAVAPSTSNSVDIDSSAQFGPRKAPTGSSKVPYTPGYVADPEQAHQPAYGHQSDVPGQEKQGGSAGAPSLPTDGFFWKPGPADPHYTDANEGNIRAYKKIGAQTTIAGVKNRLQSWVQDSFLGKQNVNEAGWQTRQAQQRQSHAILPQNTGGHFGTETYQPRQNPQAVRTQKYFPTTGHGDPGTLNSSTFGAGQVAGGIGGNTYTPTPGPPETNSTSSNPPANPSGMPTWG